jgi:O-antigen/teichoic acid export membrane protein
MDVTSFKNLFSVALFIYGSGAILALLSQILVARYVGSKEYGIYYYVMSWFLVIGVFIRFGFENTTARLLPVYMSKNDFPHAKGIMVFGSSFVMRNGVVALFLLLCILIILKSKISNELFYSFLISGITFPFVGLIYLRQATLRCWGLVAKALLPDAIITPLLIISSVFILHQFSLNISAPILMSIMAGSIIVSFLIGWHWLFVSTPNEISHASNNFKSNGWILLSFSLLCINGLQLLLNNIDALILGFFYPPEQIGIYGIASKCSWLVAFPLTIANLVFIPIFSKLISDSQFSALQKIISVWMRPVIIMALIIASILFIFPGSFLRFFGNDFIQGQAILRVLVLAQLVNVVCGPAAEILVAGGNQKYIIKILAIIICTNIIAGLAIIPRYGSMGAAIITCFSVILMNISYFWIVKIKSKIDTTGWVSQLFYK